MSDTFYGDTMKKSILSLMSLALIASAETSGYTNYSSSFDQSAFVPDIALIVDGTYVNRSIRDDEMEGYTLAGSALPDYNEFNANSGFNLNYAELSLHSDVDQLFMLDGVFHFDVEGVEIEEAYFTSTALPWYFQLKGGKFKSSFGRLNKQHQHVWDFADAPLVYNVFLTPEGLNHPGIQLQWLAPTPWYMMAGVELMQSGEEGSFVNESFTDNTTNKEITAANEPALYIAYLKNSFDISTATVLFGLSAAQGATKISDDPTEGIAGQDGKTTIYGADLLVKNYFDSYSYISWQSELLNRDAHIDNTTTLGSEDYIQSGAYSQLVYAYDQNWRAGLRFDTIFHDTNEVDSYKMRNRYTLMAEYNPSEFSRIRAQYAHNSAFTNTTTGQQEDIDTFILEINLAIGSHGAHSF